MTDPARTDETPQEVTVVNPEPIPVKIEVTTSGPARTEVDTTGNSTAKVAEAVALLTAADKVALEKVNADKEIALQKIAADERREKREFNKTLIMAIPTIIAALAAGYAAVRIDSVGHSVNSMKDELVHSVRKESHAEGMIEGAAKGKTKP